MNAAITIGGAISLLGAISLVKQVHYLRLALKSVTWPTAHGHVLAVGERPLSVGPKRQSGYYNPFIATICYGYQVGDVHYESQTIGYRGILRGTSGELQRIHRTYIHGQSVVVWYDPHDPRRAVLEPGPGASSFIRVAIGAAILAPGLTMLVAGLRATD
jgi:hypothetical protein